MTVLTIMAAEAENTGGLGALGLNLQAFLFQLISFVIVLILLRKFVYGRLVSTLEARRTAVMESLDQAKEAAKKLESAEDSVSKLIVQARKEAEAIVALATRESASMIEEAEKKAGKRAEHIIQNAESRLEQDIVAARTALRKETAELVAAATEKILRQKLDTAADSKLIDAAIKEAV